MSSIKIAESQWCRVYAFLKAHPDVYAGKQAACRRFVEGVHWVLRSGAQWCELPEQYGKWNSVYKRFAPLGGERYLDGDAPGILP